MNAAGADPATFLSGDAGDVTDPWRRTKRRLGELAYEALDTLSGTRLRAARLGRAPRITAAAGRALATGAADRHPGSLASCGCWRAAGGTRCGAGARRG